MTIYALFFCLIVPGHAEYSQCWPHGTFRSLQECKASPFYGRAGVALSPQGKALGTRQRTICMRKTVPVWRPAE